MLEQPRRKTKAKTTPPPKAEPTVAQASHHARTLDQALAGVSADCQGRVLGSGGASTRIHVVMELAPALDAEGAA